MITNYLKSALKSFKHGLFYNCINIVGLALGIACSVLILLWVSHEFSYENFNPKKNQVYRIIQDMDFEKPVSWAINQGPLGPSLVKDFPEIEKFTRFKISGFTLEYNETKFRERGGYADHDFFDIFGCNLTLRSGDSVFKDNRSIVLSEKLAKKYFKDENPIGKTLKVTNEYFMVTGVFKNVPKKTHLWYDYLLPMSFGKERGMSVDRWNNSTFYTYLLIADGVNESQINEKIRHYLDDKPTLEKNTELKLQPLSDIHLYSNVDFDFASGDIKYVRIFMIVAIFILVLACINFMNLSSARSIRRAKEIGIRKVIGASRFQLINQNLAETSFQVFTSIFIALILVKFALPSFNNIAGRELILDLYNPNLIVGLLFVLFICIIVSGLYPAIQISLFNPIQTLKGGHVKGAHNSSFIKMLVVFQFLTSVTLIISVITIQKQLIYFQNKKLGYNKEHVLNFGISAEFINKFDNIKTELLQNPYIKDVTQMVAYPNQGYAFSNTLFTWEGMQSGKEILFRNNFVGYDYFKTYQMKIVEGRDFSKNYPTDTIDALIVNQTAVKSMGMDNPIGQRLKYNNQDYLTIVGVVEDYNFSSLKNKVEPLILWLKPAECMQISIRIDENNYQNAIGFIEGKWKEYVKNVPFHYDFMNERLNIMYTSEREYAKIITYFAILAILISCLGLFGLTFYMISQKMKEIGIRKVFGGTMGDIHIYLTKTFLKWVFIANLVSWPVSWYLMDKWLDNYAYHTKINIWTFMLALGITLLIALLTILYQTIKASNSKPIDVLRYE
ncbi:MAG: ABC transporter permease [Bacteroidetes bacterium]|nr:ABC transporter permease [Bacteroidota bacterium]